MLLLRKKNVVLSCWRQNIDHLIKFIKEIEVFSTFLWVSTKLTNNDVFLKKHGNMDDHFTPLPSYVSRHLSCIFAHNESQRKNRPGEMFSISNTNKHKTWWEEINIGESRNNITSTFPPNTTTQLVMFLLSIYHPTK